MRIVSGEVRLAGTDISHHLACHHLTYLELSAARGERETPQWEAPDLAVIRELGLRHEARYFAFLEKNGLELLNLAGMDEARIVEETRRAMETGVELIAQGALRCGRWFGRPDLLRRVARASQFGDWSYEAYDCKLSRETKATTILQLAFYSELLGEMQGGTPGSLPEFMWVVPPAKAFDAERYRVAEYAAYFRYVEGQLEQACDNGGEVETYPEPCTHCDVCRWFRECEARWRGDDHLSLVAGIRRQQRDQLVVWNAETVAKLAVLSIPLNQKPLRGAREGSERVRERARVQGGARTLGRPVHETLLPVVEATGFCKLPEPSPGDLFVDLEGDPFAGDLDAGGGQQYLFGFVAAGDDRTLNYEKRWAFNADEEKSGFEWFVDAAMARWKKFPAMHVYHFGAYEPGAFKRLMGKYATREEEIDSMLRAGLFVDLHAVFKQALRAGVEEYSLKTLEHFCGFQRTAHKDDSRAAMRYTTHSLELGWAEDIPEKFITDMESYNRDDCFATSALRDWLESERATQTAAGHKIDRPPVNDGAPTEELDARQKRVQALVEKLTADIPVDPTERNEKQSATWLLAQLLDFHRRENKATYWEGYRLAELDHDDLLDERAGIAGLKFKERLRVDRNIPTDRYSFEKQETDARFDKDLYYGPERLKLGCVVEIDLAGLTIDVKKKRKTADLHPASAYVGEAPISSAKI